MTASARTTTRNGSGRLVRLLPILGWLPRYDRAWLAKDFIAAISVWALMVPSSLGYADISGVPVEYGLYAAAIALLVFPLFTTSRHAITGPSSTIAAVTGSAVLLETTGGSPEAVQLVAAITVLAGLFYIVLFALKMGWISNFLSESVLTGFIFGIGIEVVIGQLKKITGTTQTGETAWQELASWIRGLDETNLPTLFVGVGLIVMIVLLRRYAPRVPGALLAAVIGIVAARALDLASMGVALTGEVPSGLPSLALPSLQFVWTNLPLIVPAAIGVMLVGLSESLAAARQYATRYHYDIDVDQEMLAQGMSNAASGLFQGINVAGSLSKSALNESSGAKSEMASLMQGGFVVITLLFLAPLFADLPQAALGAIGRHWAVAKQERDRRPALDEALVDEDSRAGRIGRGRAGKLGRGRLEQVGHVRLPGVDRVVAGGERGAAAQEQDDGRAPGDGGQPRPLPQQRQPDGMNNAGVDQEHRHVGSLLFHGSAERKLRGLHSLRSNRDI